MQFVCSSYKVKPFVMAVLDVINVTLLALAIGGLIRAIFNKCVAAAGDNLGHSRAEQRLYFFEHHLPTTIFWHIVQKRCNSFVFISASF